MVATSLFLTSLLAGSALAAPHIGKRAVHEIKVGTGGALTYDPPAIFADVGDVVRFIFQTKNHTVTQSSFASPCGKLDGGFDTGFQFVAAGTAVDQLPTMEYTVMTPKDKPLWFYCKQGIHTAGSHCAKGMVFSINCPATGENSFDNFLAKATSDPSATEPVQPATPTNTITPLVPEPDYGGTISIPAYTTPETKTQAITLGDQTWTTTYASYPGTPEPTPAAENGTEIQITVGANGALAFEPAHVIAKPRDTLVFTFESKNHSVVQSSFATPCMPFISATGDIGINSGFMAVQDGKEKPTFRIQLTDTTPKYFYCGQTGHCGKGMVFAVNTDENGPRSSSAFVTLAKEINGTDAAGNGGNNTPDKPGSASKASFAGFALAGAIAAVAAVVL